MAGIIIPIAIHLWNVRQGKILEVGTIRFMEPSQKKRASNLRIAEWLLLLLRCLTILLFAIVMAGPIWKKGADKDEKGWLLMAPNDLLEAYEQKSFIIDSLLKNGYRLHAFEPDFKTINLGDSDLNKTDSALLAVTPNYWSLATELSATAPLGIELAIISSNRLRYFKGNKPVLNRSINWMFFQDTALQQVSISNAWQSTDDSIGILLANASSKLISYNTKFISSKSNQEKEFSFKNSEGKQTIRYQDQQPVLVDTNTIRIAIYSDQYVHDISYVTAALKAIRDFTRRKIRYDVFQTVAAIPQESDLIFWLSESQIPARFSGRILSYQKGILHQEQGFLYGIHSISETPIELYQYVKTDQKNLSAIWENGKGFPILAIDTLADHRYLLFTHFNPAWNNLIWTNRFAEWMLPFVFNGLPLQSVGDTRMIDPGQIQFSRSDSSIPVKNVFFTNTKSVANIFWFLLLLLFIIERILSFTSKKKSNV
jgi:hypothetical protein